MEMTHKETPLLRIAILDLYEGQANQGMRCIRQILHEWAQSNDFRLHCEEFDVRIALEVPDNSFDIYISSGGPGSPLESEGSNWEKLYFHWLRHLENWNKESGCVRPKHALFICHSFQLVCRHYAIAHVCQRKSTAFGVFPVHMLEAGKQEPIFKGLPDPFYSVDSRDFQVIEPDHGKMKEMGATILAIEKNRPHVPYERAIMAMRFSPYFVGTQFHPEADATGMRMYLLRDDKKQTVIENHGAEKWQSMVDQLLDPGKIMWTYQHVLPNFLTMAAKNLTTAVATLS